MSILLGFVLEFMSKKRYTAPGLYSTMGLYWPWACTSTVKSDKIGWLELLPPLIRFLLRLPIFHGADVWVGKRGGKLEAKTIEATGFHRAMVVISCGARIIHIESVCVESIGSRIFCTYLVRYWL